MSDVVERLREEIIADAFERREIVSGRLAARLIEERADAANEIERLRKAMQEMVDEYGASENETCSCECCDLVRKARAALSSPQEPSNG